MSSSADDRRAATLDWPITAISTVSPDGEMAIPDNIADRLDRPLRLSFADMPPVDAAPDRTFRLRLEISSASAEDGTFDLRVIEGGIRIAARPLACNGIATIDADLPRHKLADPWLDIRLAMAGACLPTRLSLAAASVSLVSALTQGRRAFIEAGRAVAARTLEASGSRRFADVEMIAGRIRAAIECRRPFSLVRLGDGEGRLLGHPTLLRPHELLRDTINYMFGPGAMKVLVGRHGDLALDRAVAELAFFVRSAVRSADIVAVPSTHCYGEVTEANVTAMLGFASANCYAAQAVGDDVAMTETFIFREIQRRRLFPVMLAPAASLSVVAHSDRSPELAAALGIADVRTIVVPGHHTFMPTPHHHYPEAYGSVVERLVPRRPGDVFLVAAGYLGKHYCDVVKQRGGTAIDIGAAFDGWFGVGRRDAINDPALRLVPPA